MELKKIYQPIGRDLAGVERLLKTVLGNNENSSIAEINNYLLNPKGKRLRPAMVILCAKACGQKPALRHKVTRIASAVELIHLASLIHDDVIDHSEIRHNKPTVNSKWGEDVSIALGDYLYSVGFDLISSCENVDILSCISQATRSMCEGELAQVYERNNLDLMRERYLTIVKKKTASLFAASCRAGAILSGSPAPVERALTEYGTGFGIAFQIVDDSLDLIAGRQDLGKAPGADFKMGELTLPVLNLLSQCKDKNRIVDCLRQKNKKATFEEIKEKFINSGALYKTKQDAVFYIQKAKAHLNKLNDSSYKKGLCALADYIAGRIKT